MVGFMLGVAVLAFLFGYGLLKGAESAIHETDVFISFLVGSVWCVGALIVYAVDRLREEVIGLHQTEKK